MAQKSMLRSRLDLRYHFEECKRSNFREKETQDRLDKLEDCFFKAVQYSKEYKDAIAGISNELCCCVPQTQALDSEISLKSIFETQIKHWSKKVLSICFANLGVDRVRVQDQIDSV